MDSLSFLGQQPLRYTVSELTRYLRGLIEADYRLQDVWVSGEISNLSRPSSGHLYFKLGDDTSSLGCVMWKSQVEALGQIPVGGEAVEVHGHIGVYEAGGQYQLYADEIRLAGEGAAYQAFLDLKRKLEAEGLFDQARKRQLPHFPTRLGIVTSATGAALQDALDVLERRFPLAEVVLSPSPVQGEHAPQQLMRAMDRLNQHEVELILLVRGGGSVEDLAAFNDEALARQIAASPVPVITGVGHETDFTIADFVADIRAPTPSAAAELATPDRQSLSRRLQEVRVQLTGVTMHRVAAAAGELAFLQQRLIATSPRAHLDNERQRLDDIERRLTGQVRNQIRWLESQLQGAADTLRAVGPASVLARGFALVRDQAGNIVKSSPQVEVGALVDVRLAEGGFTAAVEAVHTPGQPDV